MSKRKDQERFDAMRAANPNYAGFRGYSAGDDQQGREQLTALTCTVCGRKRNVSLEVASEEGESYVCLSCREEQERAAPPPEPEPAEAAEEPVTP